MTADLEVGRPEAWRDRFGPEPPTGHLRVILDYDAIDSGRMAADLIARSVDRDVHERMRQLTEKLKSLGPYREVRNRTGWRAAIDAIEEQLPHFNGPIRLLRNCLALAEASKVPVRIPPLLLVGPPGVGKTLFSHLLVEALGVSYGSIAFDQTTAGSQLLGSDKYWSNTSTGMLFQLLCEGRDANPVILLDELDKASAGTSIRAPDPLNQLHAVLEPQTASRCLDLSTEIAFDASLVTYIATANTLLGLGRPLLSRFEIFVIKLPEPREAVEIAKRLVAQASQHLRLAEPIVFERRCFYVLAHLSARSMVRTIHKAIAEAIAEGRQIVTERRLWQLLGMDDEDCRWH